jgi:hypothetical protein
MDVFFQGEREVEYYQNQGTNFIIQGNKNVLTLDKKIIHCSGSILINLFQVSGWHILTLYSPI